MRHDRYGEQGGNVLAKVLTGTAVGVGVDCALVEVEADLARGIPNFTIVGLGDAAV